MKYRYEEASGLSLNDVRVYYNSHKPEKLQALAYTQGNHVYIAPGQEKHLQHELGHVIQQKCGMVRPTMWMNGLPVNDDRRLEQQAESGVIPMLNEQDGIPSANDAGNPDSAVKPVIAGAQGIIQGVFLKWETGEDGQCYLAESAERRNSINTDTLWVGDIIELLKNIRDTGLINKLSREMNSKLILVKKKEEIMAVFEKLYYVEDERIRQRIVSALNNECCAWLWNVADRAKKIYKEHPAQVTSKDVTCVAGVQALVENRFSVSVANREENLEDGLLRENVTDAQRYGEVLWKIDKLNCMIDQVKAIPDMDKRNRLAELIRYDIIGYLRLQQKVKFEFKMRQMPLKNLRNHFQEAFGWDDAFPDEMINSARKATRVNGLPATCATEKSQQIPLPVLDRLSEEITNDEPVFRSSRESVGDLAKEILEKVERSDSKDRLVIFRGMDDTEALSILRFFNSSRAAEVEAAIKNHSAAHLFDVHKESDIANLGKHYGEYGQAKDYTTIRGGNYANVLLAFVLKPGAKNLLFSKSLLALHGANLRQGHEGFAEASGNEGTEPGYIGVKAELAEDSHTYSLGVAQGINEHARTKSQLLLQLLIDRVEVRRIIYDGASS